MISAYNQPLNAMANDSDFTVDHYKALLDLATKNYPIVRYSNIPYGERFLLWRHDCDYSLNRALSLAKLEHEHGVIATYFVNIHSEFYNLFERTQLNILHQIVALGHDVGLHFDAAFYKTPSENALENKIRLEADLLESFIGVRPTAFSFHNPTAAHLCCEAEKYAGLVNCYSKTFKSSVSYCSDSNGYWRFRRLFDVLESNTDSNLQVLTHPGWWQDNVMPPRQRIFRSVYGRAEAVMHQYDTGLQSCGRENYSGNADSLRFLLQYDSDVYYFYDYLWNNNKLDSLFIELWRLHQQQIKKICCLFLINDCAVLTSSLIEFLVCLDGTVSGLDFFNAVFEFISYEDIVGKEHAYSELSDAYLILVSGVVPTEYFVLEHQVCLICHLILSLANWAECQSMIAFAGLTELPIGSFDNAGANGSNLGKEVIDSDKWNGLKAKMISFFGKAK